MKRGRVAGWSSNAAARHVGWLMSVDHQLLMPGLELWAYTLTVRDVPGSARDFHGLRRAWIRRVERALAKRTPPPNSRPANRTLEDASRNTEPEAELPDVLWCWVMEWQRRGAPHLHGIIGARPGEAAQVHALVHEAWCQVAAKWGAQKYGQDVRLVTGAPGWFAYLAKHIGRGSKHYQREGLPDGWESSGRLWGHSAGWPTRREAWSIDGRAFVQVRRLVHAWAVADAKSERDPQVRRRRLAYLRRARQLPRETSAFVGVREWCPPHVQAQLLRWVAQEGHEVLNRVTGEVVAPDL